MLEKFKSKTFWGKILLIGGSFLSGTVAASDAIQQLIVSLF